MVYRDTKDAKIAMLEAENASLRSDLQSLHEQDAKIAALEDANAALHKTAQTLHEEVTRLAQEGSTLGPQSKPFYRNPISRIADRVGRARARFTGNHTKLDPESFDHWLRDRDATLDD